MHRIPNKIKRKIHALFALYFQVLQVIKNKNKNCKIELPYLLFIVISIRFYISRYHFSQFFRTSLNITWKKYFRHDFSFLTDSLTSPPLHLTLPLDKGQNLLSVTKVWCYCTFVPLFSWINSAWWDMS